MPVRKFVAYRSAGKSKIFALTQGPVEALEAVTSLGSDDARMTDDLVRELNFFLIERDEKSLDAVLSRFPNAVQMAVRAFLSEWCQPQLGMMSIFGAVEPLRSIHVDNDHEFREFVDAAYLLGLGVEAWNEISSDGDAWWAVQFSTAEPFVRASEGGRAWLPPENARLASTWTSRDHKKGNIIDHAVQIAQAATSRGKWAYLHTFEKSDDERTDGHTVSEIVVDVFDASIPTSSDEDA